MVMNKHNNISVLIATKKDDYYTFFKHNFESLISTSTQQNIMKYDASDPSSWNKIIQQLQEQSLFFSDSEKILILNNCEQLFSSSVKDVDLRYYFNKFNNLLKVENFWKKTNVSKIIIQCIDPKYKLKLKRINKFVEVNSANLIVQKKVGVYQNMSLLKKHIDSVFPSLNQNQIEYLLSSTQYNESLLDLELEKLTFIDKIPNNFLLFQNYVGNYESVIAFNFVEYFLEKNIVKMIAEYKKLIVEPEILFLVLSTLSFQLETILQLLLMQQEKLSYNQIVSKLDIHPYVIKKTFVYTKNFTVNRVKTLIVNLNKIDQGIKTFQYSIGNSFNWFFLNYMVS